MFHLDHSSCGDAESLRDSIDTPPLRIVTVKSMAELCNPPDINGRESSVADMDEDDEVVIICHDMICISQSFEKLLVVTLKQILAIRL